jgi:hypothetical protein
VRLERDVTALVVRIGRGAGSLDARESQSSLVLLVDPLWLCVHKPLHGIVTAGAAVVVIFAASKAPHARPTPCAASRALVVSRKSITASKPPAAFRANVWSLAGVELGVAF